MANNPSDIEHEPISTSLDIEQVEASLFRSKSLRAPKHARGVFGGQIISQAIVSATKCVNPDYRLHCYFLLGISPAFPILYAVEDVRNGKSYATRSVRATQKGRLVFMLMCSFHRPEPGHPLHQWPMPKDVRVTPAEELELDFQAARRRALDPDLDDKARTYLLEFAADRERSPIFSTVRFGRPEEDGSISIFLWMKARNIPAYALELQKCILAYISDYTLILTAPKTLDMKESSKGVGAEGMTSTLDHSIFFYSDDFDCSQWLLFVTKSPRIGDGRGIVEGQMYTQAGVLIAFITQEGVVRLGAANHVEKPKL